MAWIYLFIAGIAEIIWAVTMKQSQGFSKLAPSVITVVFMAISVFFLAISMRTLPLGTAYVIWTGIGAIGAFLLGVMLFNEPSNMGRIFAAILIISGLILMKINTK